MKLRRKLEQRIAAALRQAGAPEGAPALVGPATKPEFGDYQANGCMAAAKALKTNPRELAQKVIDAMDLDDLAESVDIAGPGFINIRLKGDFLADRLHRAARGETLGCEAPQQPQTVVVDYSSPNLAKEMHVGHLRSTIIGDALARVLEFLGHQVIRQNHVGDWGTQFGMLLAHLESQGKISKKDGNVTGGMGFFIGDLEKFYQQAKKRFDCEPAFAERSRNMVVKLQSGDEEVRSLWDIFKDQSLDHAEEVYRRLGVELTRKDVRGESYYNKWLPEIVAALDAAPDVDFRVSQGAKCVFLEGYETKDGEPQPLIVQKSDGGYLYATTDLAAIRYRVGELGADRVLYVTDARQSLHFEQVFKTARLAGFAPDSVSLEHVPFGVMLGPDGRPFRTRDGGTVKLMDLLDEAEQRAKALVTGKNPDLPAGQQQAIARAVGIGALKYGDLAQNRTSDYTFQWDRMLSMEGNTAPYMQYACARVRSIFRRGDIADDHVSGPFVISEPAERALALRLAQFPETLESVAETSQPHLLCGYLFDLAGAFMGFYESCPVLKAAGETRQSRLAFCDLTARVIEQGLGLLGIAAPEQM